MAKFESNLRFGQASTLILTVLLFAAVLLYVFFFDDSYNDGIPFYTKLHLLNKTVAYSFLTMFFVMAAVNIYLYVQIRAKSKSINFSNEY